MSQSVNVVAVTQSDPFFTGRFFQAFLAEAASGPVRLLEIAAAQLQRIPARPRPALLEVLRSCRHDPAGRPIRRIPIGGPFRHAPNVEALAARAGVPVRSLASINDEAYLRTLGERQVDVLLSVSAPEIFRQQALQRRRIFSTSTTGSCRATAG
jgi:hypothetical protein